MAMNDNNNDDNNTDKHSNPVTVIVKRIAKKDKIKEFEEWLSGISKEVSRQDGSMGIDNCYYSCNINSAIDYGSSTTFFNRKVINTISNKTCHCYYDNSSPNDLCDHAASNKIIKTLVIQDLRKSIFFLRYYMNDRITI
jgi:hypothetical protein